MKNLAFDNELYLKLQSKKIVERIQTFGNKLYLEFGGKLFDDHHASRVLPGFEPDSKLKMLLELKNEVEVVIAICAHDIEKKKIRSDIGITYDVEVLRLIDAFLAVNLYVGSVVITRYAHQESANNFMEHLKKLNIKVFIHYQIEGYPNNIPFIVSEEGYGKNDFIETKKPLIVVTAPGPGSGKMATCLSQLYQEHQRGVNAGYAKFETFPIWNLPLKHPLNLAYEAATADLNDINMIDPFHLEAYNETTVNYNRDVEIFPVLHTIFERILGKSPYLSPTDMGVNMTGFCIKDDDQVKAASMQEIIRRYFRIKVDYLQGHTSIAAVNKIKMVMSRAEIDPSMRSSITPALKKAEETGAPAFAITLANGQVVVGKTSPLLGASSSALLNALKQLAGIDDKVLLISPTFIEPIQHLKINTLKSVNPRLHTDEVLIALAISATNDPLAKKALDMLDQLKGCDAHSTVILSAIDTQTFRKLHMQLTCFDQYQTKRLYHQ